MFKNYFYLARSINELNNSLADSKITEAYSQEKERLYLRMPSEDYPDRHLIISTDQNFPFISIKDAHYKAKKNTVDFFSSYLPDKIINFEIAEDDRVIKINLEIHILYFFIRGNNTNILIDNNNGNFSFFKNLFKEEPNNLYDEITKQNFIPNIDIKNFSKLNSKETLLTDLKTSYPTIGKEIFNEVNLRDNINSLDDIKGNLNTLIFEVLNDDICCFYDKDLNKARMLPEEFHFTDNNEALKSFDNYQDAIRYVARLKYSNEAKNKIRKSISTVLNRELNKISSRINKLSGRIEKGSNEDIYYHYGNLLITNINELQKGSEKVILRDYLTDELIEIKLDPKNSPNQNCEKYFKKARDEKINFEKSKELYNNSIIDFERFSDLKDKYENAETIDELKSIAESLKIKDVVKGNKKVQDTAKFKHYLIENKFHVYVGKDSKSNDYLSIKFAKQNDYWFHARGLPGSHVVLRVENTKEVVPKNILKSAASLAAFHSKAKTAGTAPVSYCFAKFVTKRKGMEPGKVTIQKEKVLLVKPEIPKNTEFIEE